MEHGSRISVTLTNKMAKSNHGAAQEVIE